MPASAAAHLPAAHLAVAHLADEQFTDLLLGAIPPAVIAHLEACPCCTQEADRVSGAIGSFAQQSRLWAERRAASRPARTPAHRTPRAWPGVPAAALAWVAATLALVAGIGIAYRAERPASAPHQVAEVVPIPAGATVPAATAATTGRTGSAVASATTLKADNELLSAIDGELTDDGISGAQTYVQSYALTSSRHAPRQRASKGISN